MARERTIKDTPKRGKLKRSEIKRVVKKVVSARGSGGEAEQPRKSRRKK